MNPLSKKCNYCKIIFNRNDKISILVWNKQRYCSRACWGKVQKTIRLKENGPNWKTKRYKVDSNGCWNWLLTIDPKGYGKHLRKAAHREYYEMYKGKIPRGLQIDHKCRNRKCVNPDHLEAVTLQDNIHRGKLTKLTKKEVELIRDTYKNDTLSFSDLGRRFNINPSHASRIVQNKIWRESNKENKDAS